MPSSLEWPSGTLYQIVLDHIETFRARAASLRDGEGLPRFVEQECRDFLQCGWMAGGFARFRCAACGLDFKGFKGFKGLGGIGQFQNSR